MRPTNRTLLASFIEYAAKGVVTPNEWHRFMVNHYQDPIMEQARHECGRVIYEVTDAHKLSKEQQEYLFRLAKVLRDAT